MARILVVDDEPEIVKVLLGLLTSHGHEVRGEASAEAGLETLAREAYDLVILDVRLPGLSGFEACARIRQLYGPAVPVILLTAFGDRDAVRQGYEAGADDFLRKPPDMASIIYKVRALLRLRALHDEAHRSRLDAQDRARALALLHEIGRDWSRMAQPEEFTDLLTRRLAGLIQAPVCVLLHYDRACRVVTAAQPAHGLADEVTRRLRCGVEPEHRVFWDFKSRGHYLTNQASSDPRLLRQMVQLFDIESALLVPMISESEVLGVIAACNKPGGFDDSDGQLLSIFAGPAATFLKAGRVAAAQLRHAANLERLSELVSAVSSTTGRPALLELTVTRLQRDFACQRVAFYRQVQSGGLSLEAESGGERPGQPAFDQQLMAWAVRGTTPLRSDPDSAGSEVAIPVRAGDRALGALCLLRWPASGFDDQELNLLTAFAGQLSTSLQKTSGAAETERLARQMATLYELSLETTALREIRSLFVKATEEAGRLIQAHHTSAFRLDPTAGELRLFTAWARDPGHEPYSEPVFRLGEGIAGRVAQDQVPALVNDAHQRPDFVPKANPVSRLICVPLTYFDRERSCVAVFGVLNATRRPGAPPFTQDDLDYLTRFASQLSVAVANSMAFAAERERSEQLALVNTLLREIAGSLSRQSVLETAARRIHEKFGYSAVAIVSPDRELGVNRLVFTTGPLSLPEANRTYPLSAGIPGRALRDQCTVVVPDVAKDTDYLAVFPEIRSEVAIPILAGDEVIAVLDVGSSQAGAFDREQVITLETSADGIGIILRNAELFHALEQTNAKLVELDRMKSELVNVMAHDFRAPLSGILSHAELLQAETDSASPDSLERVGSIVRAATHMATLVDRTLKTMRLDTGYLPFEFRMLDLGEAAREVLARLPADPARPITAELPEDPVPCWADRDRILEVFENLVANAIKYSPDGGTIRFEVDRGTDQAEIRVVDEGLGIPAEQMDRLFRPFSRVRDPRVSGIEGSGLGLYICDRIVRAHGGRLWASSRVGEGSTFSVSLPLYGPAAYAQRPLILVAAGDDRTRRQVGRLAEEAGLDTYEVADGVEAVEAAIRLMPQAVVLDQILPRLTAEEVAARLKDTPGTATIPIVALSSAAEPGAAPAPFSARLPKPLDRASVDVLVELMDVRWPRLATGEARGAQRVATADPGSG